MTVKGLSGSLSKSGPLDFWTKNNFTSFLSLKRAWRIYKNQFIFSNFLVLLCYEPKLHFGRTEVADRDQKRKILGFFEGRFVP